MKLNFHYYIWKSVVKKKSFQCDAALLSSSEHSAQIFEKNVQFEGMEEKISWNSNIYCGLGDLLLPSEQNSTILQAFEYDFLWFELSTNKTFSEFRGKFQKKNCWVFWGNIRLL